MGSIADPLSFSPSEYHILTVEKCEYVSDQAVVCCVCLTGVDAVRECYRSNLRGQNLRRGLGRDGAIP